MRARRLVAITPVLAVVAIVLLAAQTGYASPASPASKTHHHHKHLKHASGKASRGRAVNSAVHRSSDPGVTIADFLFSPGTITIHVGDTIVWTNNGPSAHTATANNGSFDTGVLAKGKTASVSFHTPGTFDYHCTIHPFMHGAVIVLAATTTPSTTKTTPSPSSTTPGGATPSNGPSNSSPSNAPNSNSPGASTSSSSTGTTLPLTGVNVLALVLTGLALTGTGLVLRRLAKP